MKIGLKEIVSQYLSSSDMSSHAFQRLYQIGIRGVREFNTDIFGAVKTVLLDVAPNKTVEFPEDCVTYLKVGYLDVNGNLICFARQRSFNHCHEENILSNSGRINSDFHNVWVNYYGENGFVNIAGSGSVFGTVGYTVEEEKNYIRLESGFSKSQIALEYISTGLDCDLDDYMIDVRASECFVCYIRWKDSQDNRKKFGRNEIEQLKREYYREKKLAKIKINPVRIADMQNVVQPNALLI